MIQDLTVASEVTPLRDYLDVLRRRKTVIIQTFAAVVLIGLLIGFVIRPVYRSTTTILVEGKSLTLAQYDTNNPLSSLLMTDPGYDVETQVEVLQSPHLLDDVYTAAGVPSNETKVNVKQVKDTNVIEITADSHYARYAEAVARTLPSIYLNYISTNRKSEVSGALDFAQQQLDAENLQLDKSALALERFQKQANVVDLDTEQSQRITSVISEESDVRKAKSDLASAKARLNGLLAARAKMPALIDVPNTATNITQRQAQSDKIDQMKAERAKMLVLYKPNSAQIRQVDVQIAELEDRLAHLPEKITTTVRSPNPAIAEINDKVVEAQVAVTSQQAALNDALARLKDVQAGLNKFNPIQRVEQRLKRERDEHQDVVSMLAKSVTDLSMRKEAEHKPFVTVEPAGPAEQIAPQRLRILILAMLIGLGFGLGFALLQEYLDDRINSQEEARRILGIPALGYIPLIDKEENRQLYQSSNSGSLLESYRILRSNVRFATVDEPVCSILVTSTIPGEGKSTTAANLAVAMALDERRVILVDADLRRPTVHKKFNMQLKPGLTDVLVGVLPLEAALRDTNIPGLRVLAAGPIPPNPVELLSSRTMHQIHRTLKEMADVIIFDSPPCLVTADAQVLSAEVDGVLYVMQFGETKKTGARHAVELLSRAQARLLGVVFNKISVESNSYYSGYYHYGSEQIEPMRGNGVSKHLPSQNHLSEAVVKHDRSTEEGKPISSSEHENKDLKET